MVRQAMGELQPQRGRERMLRRLSWSAAAACVGIAAWASVRAGGDDGLAAGLLLAGALAALAAVVCLLRRAQRLLSDERRLRQQLASAADRERVRADRAEHEAAHRKAAELDLVGRLSGCMAHDFNNALLVIFAAVDRLGRADVPVELEPAVGSIRLAAVQAASTARQLRAFGAHTSHSVTRVMLGPSVRRLGALLARVLPSNIELSLDVADEVAISADETHIQRLLTGLVLRSRDAMPDGGRVVLRVKNAASDIGAFALLEVEDDGADAGEGGVQRLFEPPFEARGGASTGLGLASMRQRVEAAGGRISASRRPGGGSTFSVYWPLAEAEARVSPVRSSGSSAVNGAGIHVLVIDDDTQVRSVVVRGLRRFGFSVLEAGDGREGLRLARSHHGPVHVLCADCIMPGMPLRDLVAGFRDAHPRASVVVCSGQVAQEVALPPGAADRFMAKPFQARELASCIHDLRERAGEPPARPARFAAGAA